MKAVAIRSRPQGNLFGNVVFDDTLWHVSWAYCSGGIIRYQVPIEDFLALIFDATADFIGDDELQKAIDAAQRIRSLKEAS